MYMVPQKQPSYSFSRTQLTLELKNLLVMSCQVPKRFSTVHSFFTVGKFDSAASSGMCVLQVQRVIDGIQLRQLINCRQC